VIPGVLGLFGACLLIRNLRKLSAGLLLVGFLTVSLIAGGSGSEMFDVRLPSYLQMVAAIACAHVLLCSVQYSSAIRRSLLIWLVFITVGVIAESALMPVKDLSEAFRQSVYSGRFLYANDVRDMVEYGTVRPKLFTQEPSHISKAFIVFGSGWYLLAPYRRRLIILLVCTVIVTYFLRSPFTLLGVPVALFLARMASGRKLSGVLVWSIPVAGFSAVAFTQIFAARFATIQSGQDFSFFTRYQGPYEVAVASIQQHPIFGVGIGAKEALWDEVQRVYSPFFGSMSALYKVYLDYFNNGLANSIMFFGVIGALAFFTLVAYWIKQFDIGPSVSLPIVGLFFLLDGALEGIRMWSSIALVLGCYALAATRQNTVDSAVITSQPNDIATTAGTDQV